MWAGRLPGSSGGVVTGKRREVKTWQIKKASQSKTEAEGAPEITVVAEDARIPMKKARGKTLRKIKIS